MAIEINMMRVTPGKAEHWLNSKNKGNRNMRDGVAERYASDMQNGRWTNCPEPISFYEDGELADGQHRLWAIIESGRTISFPIATGLTRPDGLNINRGLGRSLIDNAAISGLRDDLTHSIIATCRGIDYDPKQAKTTRSGRSLSDSETLILVDKHGDAARFAITNGPKSKYLNNAVVRSAIARAYYVEEDKAKLARFCEVMKTGFFEGDKETAAIAIRNYMLQKGPIASQSSMWGDTFRKIQHAIHNFMKGTKQLTVRPIEHEAYPLKKSRR
jgi:hypothetical protein